MPQNYFSGGVGDVLAAGEAGAGFVDDWMDRAAKQRAGYAAAPRIARGDYRGAAGAYAQEGMADEARTLMGDQNTMDRQARQDELAAAGKRMEVLKATRDKLLSTPFGQRRAVLGQGLQLFQAVGYPADFLQRLSNLTEDQLSDDFINTAVGQVEDQWRMVNNDNGEIGAYRDTAHGPEYRTLRQPDKKPPGMFVENPDTGEWEVNPLYVQAQRQVYDARAAGTAAHRAPPRGRSGGGGGLSSVSTADLVAAIRGAR